MRTTNMADQSLCGKEQVQPESCLPQYSHGPERSICRFVIVGWGVANLRLGLVDGHGKWHLVRIGAALAAIHGCEHHGPRAASFVRSRTDGQRRRAYGLAGGLGRRRSKR
jgi:hypothetical protein